MRPSAHECQRRPVSGAARRAARRPSFKTRSATSRRSHAPAAPVVLLLLLDGSEQLGALFVELLLPHELVLGLAQRVVAGVCGGTRPGRARPDQTSRRQTRCRGVPKLLCTDCCGWGHRVRFGPEWSASGTSRAQPHAPAQTPPAPSNARPASQYPPPNPTPFPSAPIPSSRCPRHPLTPPS